MTNFLDSQYQIIKQAISPDTAKISYQYLINKRELYFKTKKSWPKIIKDNIDFEMFGYLGDFQAPTTWLNLGGDLWPIYLEPDIKVELTPGDMLVYKGAEIAHWRHVFTGKECAQVFLHYTRKGTGKKYDGRQFLCLPKIYVK